MRKSLVGSVNRACAVSACARFSSGRSRGSWMLSAADDRDHLAGDAVPPRLEHHARRTAGRSGSWASCLPILVMTGPVAVVAPSSPSSALHRAELGQQVEAVLDAARVRRLQERERGDVAEPERDHLQDDRGEVGAQDLRLGVLRAAWRSPPRSRAGWRCRRWCARCGRTAGSRRPARSPRSAAAAPSPARCSGEMRAVPASITYLMPGTVRLVSATFVASTIRRRMPGVVLRLEHPVLIGARSAARRAAAPRCPRRAGRAAADGILGVADLALAAEEDEHVAVALAGQFVEGGVDRRPQVVDRPPARPSSSSSPSSAVSGDQRPVADLDREGAAAHLDDRAAVAEVARRSCPGRSSPR